MHILDDTRLSPRVLALLTRARRSPALSAEQARELARAATVSGGGNEGADRGKAPPVPGEVVEAMVRFEERYGGLRYPLLGPNEMEHGLDGGTIVRTGVGGWSFSGILDGDETWPVDVLLDGRTAMTLAERPRIINSSISQRLESQAQLAHVRDWPHVTLGIAVQSGEEPAVTGVGLPALDVEATGPADKWWCDGETAVHLQLRNWWGPEDIWVVRCFAARAMELAGTVEALRRGVAGGVVGGTAGGRWRDEGWCLLCARSRQPAQPCAAKAFSSACRRGGV